MCNRCENGKQYYYFKNNKKQEIGRHFFYCSKCGPLRVSRLTYLGKEGWESINKEVATHLLSEGWSIHHLSE